MLRLKRVLAWFRLDPKTRREWVALVASACFLAVTVQIVGGASLSRLAQAEITTLLTVWMFSIARGERDD